MDSFPHITTMWRTEIQYQYCKSVNSGTS